MNAAACETTGRPPAAGFARRCVEAAVLRQAPPEPPADAFFRRRAGCFVSIKRRGELRGCIGTLTPAERDLGDEIAGNASAAAFRDPRFSPISPEELADLTYSVDVLGASEPCAFKDLDPLIYGVIVSAGAHRGVLLPDLPGVETAGQQLAIVLQKAGIAAQDPYTTERFQVERFSEQEAQTAGD